MNQNIPPITDDDLHAFVDGALDPERQTFVAAYLAQNPQQQRRVDLWQRQRDLLREGLDSILTEPLPPELTMAHLLEQRRRNRFAWFAGHARIAALILLAFGIGASSGWFGRADLAVPTAATATGIAALKLETSAAYRIFAPAPRTADDTAAPAHAHATTLALAHAVGQGFTVPDLTAAGYTVARIDWLATMHGPAAVVMYRAADTQPLLLLVRKMDVPATSDRMTEDHHHGRSMFTWISHGVGFAVASASAPDRLHHIANQIRADERAL
jgi:anti-sigma factor RsiW